MVTMNINDMNISWDMSDMNDTMWMAIIHILWFNGGFGKPVERHPSRSTKKSQLTWRTIGIQPHQSNPKAVIQVFNTKKPWRIPHVR